MSAPQLAKRTAIARPKPRPAPVMSTTLPSSLKLSRIMRPPAPRRHLHGVRAASRVNLHRTFNLRSPLALHGQASDARNQPNDQVAQVTSAFDAARTPVI